MTNIIDTIKGFSKHELASSLSNKNFQLILFPTEQCNFRCVYCYEDFEIGKMPNWLIKSIKIFLKNKIQNLNQFSFSWFGGEPLLAKNIIFEVVEEAQRLGKEYDCKVIGGLTTNGLLLDIKTLTKLVELKQNDFQISIDGDKEAHDQTRITRTGKGSFDKIWARLTDAAATSLNFNITLRVHVTDLNQESVLKFCKRYDQILSSDVRFKLFFKAIENLGGERADKVNTLISKQTAKELVRELSERYAKDNDIIGKNYVCYASKPNSLAIRADGNLNKCTVALSDDRNSIGKINSDGTLTINNQKYSSWIKGFTTLDTWQMGCPLSYMNHHASAGDIPIKKVG